MKNGWLMRHICVIPNYLLIYISKANSLNNKKEKFLFIKHKIFIYMKPIYTHTNKQLTCDSFFDSFTHIRLFHNS